MRAPRILLIRDDDETHQELRRQLERRGCRVFQANGQREAVELARRVGPDLLVQENAVPAAERPAAVAHLMAAVEILAGPLPHPRAGWPSPRRTHSRPRRRALAGMH